MNRIHRLVALALCGMLIVTTIACAKRQKGPSQRPPVPVQTSPAAKMDAPVVIDAFGTTKDRASVDIVPQVSGMLIKTLIKDGDRVTQGQPLFQIDPNDYAARVRQADAAVAADRANLDLGRITLERNRTLLDKKLISQEDFDTLKTRVAAAEAQLHADEAALDQARLNLARCTITAPWAGVCSKRYVDDGNLVAAGQTRLTNIRSYDPIYVDITSMSDKDLPLIRKALAEGQVKIQVAPEGDTATYPGTLQFVDNAVNPLSGTIALRGQVPNPDLKLWAQVFVKVRLSAGLVHDAVMVPEGAVQFGKQGPYLFVVSKTGQAELRLVKTGLRYNDLVQIVEGVTPGENVVVLGQLMLAPGSPVVDVANLPKGGDKPGEAGPQGAQAGATGHGGK